MYIHIFKWNMNAYDLSMRYAFVAKQPRISFCSPGEFAEASCSTNPDLTRSRECVARYCNQKRSIDIKFSPNGWLNLRNSGKSDMKKSESHDPLSYIFQGNESSAGPKFLASIRETPTESLTIR